MDLKINTEIYHRSRKQYGIYDWGCAALQMKNPDNSSIFIKFDGEYMEVTKFLLDIVDKNN